MASGVGLSATLRLRIGTEGATRAGGPLDPSRLLALVSDVARELTIRLDGDEGDLRLVEGVELLAPVSPGDYVEVTGVLTQVGQITRHMAFEARKVIVVAEARGLAATAADALAQPVIVMRALATYVVPPERQRRPRIVLPALGTSFDDAAELPEGRPIVTPPPHVVVTPLSREVVLECALPAGPPPEVAEAAVRARDEGAAVVQLSAPAPPKLRELISAVRARCDVLTDARGPGADLVSVDGDAEGLDATLAEARAAGSLPILEVSDFGGLAALDRLLAAGQLSEPARVRFVLGTAKGAPARLPVLRFLVSQLPPGTSWGVAGPSDRAPLRAREDEVAVEVGLAAGGHVCVTPDRVALAREVAERAGCVVVDPERARQLLALPRLR